MGARSLSQFKGGYQGLERILMLGGAVMAVPANAKAGFTGFAATADRFWVSRIRRDGRSGTLAA